MNPWAAFTLYVAGLVYCHDLRLSYEPTQDGLSNVTFLLAVMKSIDLYQPITEYFTVQLEIELETAQRNRKGKQRQGRILCAPREPESDTSELVQEFEDDSQPWNTLSSEKAAGPYANPPFHQPLIGILSLNCGNDTAPEQQTQAATSNSSPNSTSAQSQERPRHIVPTEYVLPSSHERTILNQQYDPGNQSSRGVKTAGNDTRQERQATLRVNAYDGTSAAYEWNGRFAIPSHSYGQEHPESRGPVLEKPEAQAPDAFRGTLGDQSMANMHHALPHHTRASAFDEIFTGDPHYETFQGLDWDTFNNEYWNWNQN